MAKAVEQTSGRAAAWDVIDWKTHEQHVRCIQERIFRATRDKRWGIVKNLQKLLVRSLSARLVAIKRVTQDGKNFVRDLKSHVKCNGSAVTRASLEGASPVLRNEHAGFLEEGAAVMPPSYSTSEQGVKYPLTLATGLKLSGPGEWLQKVHHPGTRKVWLKFHIDAIAPTHEIRVHALTGSDVRDGPMFVPLLTKAKQKGPVGKALGDKGYDAKDHFEACAKDHIVAGILPKKNASTRARGGPARAKAVWEIKKVGLKEWKKAVRYSERWAAERAFSIFKRVLGDKVRAREWDTIVQEVALKVQVLNYYLKRLNACGV